MNGIASPTAPSGSGADGCPGPGVTSDTEDLPAFASTAQEVNYYARFLQFLVTGLPSARDRAVGAQWSLVLTAGPPQPGVHDEYLKQLLVCCTVGRLLGVFSSPPASSWLPPLPEHHSVAWLTKAAHALRERERRQGAGDPSERQRQQQQPADEAEEANEKAGEAGRGAPAPTDNAGEAQGQRRAADGDEPEPVPAPPVQAEVSAGGTQYLAVQDGGGSADESHFYYAFSTEPLPHWVGAVDPDLGETSHGTQDHKTGGSGSVPWLSSHEGEGLDWLLANPGFLSLPSAERPASDLWQEASPELQAQAGQRPRGDAFDDLPPTPFAALQHQDPDAHAPGGYVWVEDEFGGLTEVPVETLAAEEDEDFGEDDADEDEWRPAEQVIAELGATGLGGVDPSGDTWSLPAVGPFSPAASLFGSPGGGVQREGSTPSSSASAATPHCSYRSTASDRKPRSQVRIRISTPSREDVVVPGESSPRTQRSAGPTRPPSPSTPSAPRGADPAMYRRRSSSLDEPPLPFRPPYASSFHAAAAGAGRPPPDYSVGVSTIYPSNAPIAVAALALPVGQRPQQRPWGMAAAAWPGGGGGASYEDSQYPSSSYGTYEAGGWFPGGGAGGGGWDSLGQSYGSAETTEPTHAGSSLGAGGWPYRYSLSRSQSAPATSASEGASTLNEGMLSGSAGSEASASFRDVYYDETHYAPQPPATPRPSRRRRAARDTDLDLSDADGSLFKPVTTGRHVTRQPTRPQPQRALSDSDMFNARQQVHLSSDSSWRHSAGSRRGSAASAASGASTWSSWRSGAGPAVTSTPRSRAAGPSVRRALHFSDSESADEEPVPSSAGVSGPAYSYDPGGWGGSGTPSARSAPSAASSPGPRAAADLAVAPYLAVSVPGADTPPPRPRLRRWPAFYYNPSRPEEHVEAEAPQHPQHQQRVLLAVPSPRGRPSPASAPPPRPAQRQQYLAPTPPSAEASVSSPTPRTFRPRTWQTPQSAPAAVRQPTAATISATVYPDATVATAAYQAFTPPGRPQPVRHGWFRVRESGRPAAGGGWGPAARVPLEASIGSSAGPQHRSRRRPWPSLREGLVPRRLNFSDLSSSTDSRGLAGEPEVEFPPSSPSSAYDTSFHTAQSSSYGAYQSF